MNRIAVLHLMNGFEDSSISRIVQRLVQHLGQQDYVWHIGGLSGLGDMQEQFSCLGTQVVDFSDRHNGGSGSLGRRIREYAVAHRLRLVHTHTPRTILAARMALAGTHETIHLATKHLLYSPGDRHWGLIYTLLDRFTLYLPDHLVTVSENMHRQVLAYPRIGNRRVTMIRNGIDCQAYYSPDQRDSCRLEFGLTSESQAIGYAGRIEKMKRLDLLLEAFSPVLAGHPQARLMIVGEGKLRPKLEAFADRLGISHAVIWTGFRRDISRLLAGMDIYVQPSANEGLSLSLVEAMAAGKPIIATDVGGASELVVNGMTGVLIPSGSSAAIQRAISDLLDDRDRQSALAQGARNHVMGKFGVQQTMDAYRHLYEELALQ
jgi:glycosyltransferase involved in cell wall biosynthesis